MCALPLVYVHVTAEYPPVPVQPQVQLQALILLQDLPPKLVLEMTRLLLAEPPEQEPRPEQEQPPEQEKPPGPVCIGTPVS